MTESDKAVMQMALDWISSHGGIVFAGGGMNAVYPMNQAAVALRKAIAQTEQTALIDKQRCADYEAGYHFGFDRGIAQPEQTTQEPNAWRVSGTNRLYDQHEAEQEAKRCGGSSRAYPVYAEPQSVKPDLVAAAQAVLDRWNSPQWDWVKCGPTGDLMQVLRDALVGQSLTPTNKHALLLAEAYQVVGSLLSDLGQFDTDKGRKVLDNLSQGRMVHNDVLPWPSFAKKETEFSIADLALEHFGEYSEKYYNFATALLNLRTK